MKWRMYTWRQAEGNLEVMGDEDLWSLHWIAGDADAADGE